MNSMPRHSGTKVLACGDAEDLPRGLALEQITIALDGHDLVQLDERVAPGEVLTLMGPSGSGKSTLLNLISGFLPAAFQVSGDVKLNGRSILSLPPQERKVGILFQRPMLFPHMSVGANLLAGLRQAETVSLFSAGMAKRRAKRREEVEEALETIGLSGFFNRDPATLSGGQQTRVALMRMLLSRPEALLLDEPFSNLDKTLRNDIRAMTFAEAKSRKLPTLLVTHDEQDAYGVDGKLLELQARN